MKAQTLDLLAKIFKTILLNILKELKETGEKMYEYNETINRNYKNQSNSGGEKKTLKM